MKEIILIVEDEPTQRQIMTVLLGKKLGYKVIEAENGKQAIKQIESSNVGAISAVLLDINMPEMDGFDVLQYIQKYRPDLPVVMLTAENDTNIAVKAIKQGASDFIVKPPRKDQLDIAIKNAIRLSRLSQELKRLKRDNSGALSFHDLIGYDGGIKEAINYGQRAAASDVPVLITGEISTGKELLARAIHGESRRVGRSFISVDCSAISEDSLENILFGHDKERNAGKFREADRGTIFLDNIHLLPASAQNKLLCVLQHGEIKPAGSGRGIKVNLRIIAATDSNLKKNIQVGLFREDLYFKLAVLIIDMPPLRERKNDILLLSDYFIHRISSMDSLPIKKLSANAKYYLSDYSWPGNIQELEGLLHRALVLCEKDKIDRALLLRIHDTNMEMDNPSMQQLHINIRQANGMFKPISQIESEVMQTILDHYDNNVTRTSEALGIAKSTFYRKMANMIQT